MAEDKFNIEQLISIIKDEAKEIIGTSQSMNLNALTPFGKGYAKAIIKAIELIEKHFNEING